jgi:uncharacterized protein involved in exopolysaccharide biosynthesis
MNIKSNESYRIFQSWFLKRAIVGSVISFVLVLIITMPLIMKPLYESETIVYAPLTLFSQQLNQHGIGFAGEQEIEYYIQILSSYRLADSLVKKFSLFHAHGSDLFSSDDTNLMYQRLKSRMHIEKTRYGSVSIRIRDNDPEKASAMANEVVKLGESIKEKLSYTNRLASLQYTQNLYEQKKHDVMILEQKIDSLHKLSSGERAKQEVYQVRILKSYDLELQELISRKNRYELEKNAFDTPLPAAYVVSTAVPSYQAVYPKRLLLALAAVAIYLVLIIAFRVIKHDFANPS